MLALPASTTVIPGSTVTLPVTFTSHGEAISSVVFSLDYDEDWLSLDPADGNSDGMPDAVHFTLPVALRRGRP